ncbi:MAG: hypothetical protein ACR2FY_02845 [Pirellulaceae bacterium]
MNILILLLFAADPTGLQAAFESADSMDISFARTWFTVTLVNPQTIRKMAPLVQVEGEAHKLLGGGIPGTQEIIRVTLHGKKKTDFWLLGNREIVFGGDLIKTADDKLWVALRAYFEPPDSVFVPSTRRRDGQPGFNPSPREPTPVATALKTLKAAFEGDTLDLKNLTTGKSCTVTNKAHLKEMFGMLRFKEGAEVSYIGKLEGKNMVEFVLGTKETRTRFFLLGDTLAWGDKHHAKVQLEDDILYMVMLHKILEAAAPKPPREDRTGFLVAVEAAETMELSFGGKTVTLKDVKKLQEIAQLVDTKRVIGAMAPGGKFLENKEVIEIVTNSKETTTRFKLVRGDDEVILVFGRQNLLAKMTNQRLWQELRAQFPMPEESAFPPASKPKDAPKVAPPADPTPDPTGLQAAFESADSMDISFARTWFTVTLVNPQTIRKLAPLIEVRGEPERLAHPATPEIIRVTIHGKKTTEFWMTKSKIAYSDKLMTTAADDKLWVALRGYFEPPMADPPKGARIPGPSPEPPTLEESVQKTLTAAMKAADTLDVTYRGVTVKWDVGPHDGIRNVHLAGLKLAGDVKHYAKKPEDPVEVVFVNKETRIPIYLVGDTAYWGEGKHWKSVKLTRDSMWKQVVTTTPPKSELEPKPVKVVTGDPAWQPDAPFLKASIEAAAEVKVTYLKDSFTVKGKGLQEIAKLVKSDGKAVDASQRAGTEVIRIQIVKDGTTHYRLFSDDVLVNGEKGLVVGIKLDHDLWGTLRSRFKPPEKPAKTGDSAFPPKPDKK